MLAIISTESHSIESFKTRKILPTVEGEHDVFQRQTLLEGFDQAVINKLRVNLIGAGGLGSEIGIALIKKGVGTLNIFDPDVVTITNLPRQFYFREDLYRPKPGCLAKNLARLATNDSTITAYNMSFQEAVDREILPGCDVAIVGVDNSDTRFFCSQYYYLDTPVIFTAVSIEADSGYVFVQEPGEACFGCVFEDQFGKQQRKCSGSTIDIHKVMAGLVSYAVDSLFMGRVRNWNFKSVYLTGFLKDLSMKIERNEKCRFCNTG